MMDGSQKSQSRVSDRAEIDIRALFGVLWRGKWWIVSITAAVIVIAVVLALRLPDIYRAEALLAPNDRSNGGRLSALAAQYGGLASLAGLTIGDNSGNKTAMGLKILESRQFIAEFVERRDILVPLMAAKGWDRATDQLEIDASSYDTQANKWIRKVPPPRQAVPSSQEAFQRMKALLTVSQDTKSGFVTIAVEHYSPTIAKQWVDWLVEDLNTSFMRDEVAEAEQAIAYLQQQIESTSVSDLQNVFYELIEEQTKTMMLAEVTDEYLLRTLDPAVVPETKTRPMRSILVIFAAFLGFFLAVAVVLLLASIRQGAVAQRK